MKIAIFGGSFDPPHLGHLILAESVAALLKYDRILFIPDKIPPHKKISGEVSDIDRLNMIKLSIEGNQTFTLEDYELKNDRISYTLNTINYIYENYRNIEGRLGLIIGGDLVSDFHKWKEPKRISEITDIIAVNRGSDSNMQNENINQYNMKVLNISRIDISSTIIRERIKKNISIRYLVLDNVFNYIFEHNLYI